MIDLLALLKRLEWGDNPSGDGCTICLGERLFGHGPDCQLAEAIRMLEGNPIEVGQTLILEGLKRADVDLASIQEEYERHMPCVPGTPIRIRLVDEPPNLPPIP